MTADATPDPASLDVAARVTVPRRYGPGSVIVTEGPVLSMRRPATVAEAVVLPAPSVARRRRS